MGKKILLADDSITIQKVIELTFSDEDFDVVTVGNGRLAIEKVQEIRPDVVLCDVIMPEKDGYEVCDFIKRSPQLGATPVLLLTGAFEPFDQERAARVGCDGFLAKPFEPETLIAKVKELLSKAAARHAPVVAAVPEPMPPPLMAPPPPPAPVAVATPFTVTPVPVVAPPAPPFQAAPSHAAFAPEPPHVVEEPEMAFIPDEPFEDLDTPSFDAPAAATPEPVGFAPAPDPVEELLPMTAEESESLAPSGDDASATVMFRADSLPWSSPAAPAPAPARVAEEQQPEIVGDLPGFEEIIEEDTEVSSVLMSPPPVFVPEPAPMPEPVPMPVAAAPAPPPVPVVVPPPAPFPVPPSPVVAAPLPPPPVVVAPPAPPPVAPPVVVAAPPPPVAAPAPPPPPPYVAPPPVLVSPPVVTVAPPVFAPPPEPVVAPTPPPPVVEASSFADLAAEIQEPEAPATPSVAAQVDVPVDMVAQIAQRVVAQVSEKVVERIAWEVIPELAEALIKREIERLKAELQQLT